MKWTVLVLALVAYVANAGAGTALRWLKLRYPGQDEDDDAVKCGGATNTDSPPAGYTANDDGYIFATPNKIRQCYYTDCFSDKLSDYPALKPTAAARRRMGDGYRVNYAPRCNTGNTHIVNNATGQTQVVMAGNRKVLQWKYWVQDPGHKLETSEDCTEGWQTEKRPDKTRKQVMPPQKNAEGVSYKNCMFEEPPTGCQCRTIYCVVEQEEEALANKGKQLTDLVKHDCSFIVRIEGAHWGPSLAKYTMWIIFGCSAFLGLVTTLYFYLTFGDELVKEGDEEGSDKAN